MRIKVKDKKRLGKNYWLNCDPYCYWISEEYEVKKGKTAGPIAERNVSGYTATFEQAVNSFIEKGIKAAEIDDFMKLVEVINDLKKEVESWKVDLQRG